MCIHSVYICDLSAENVKMIAFVKKRNENAIGFIITSLQTGNVIIKGHLKMLQNAVWYNK